MPGPKKKHVAFDEEFDDLPVINEFSEEALADETPPDIDQFLSELGIANKQYTCTIKQYPPDGTGTPIFMPGGWKGSYPSISELGSKFGPGKYLYVFTWRVTGPDGKYKNTVKQTEVILGEQWQEAHDEYIYQYNVRRKKKLASLKMKEEQNRILNGDDYNKQEKSSGIDNLIEAKNQMAALGVNFGGGNGGMDLVSGEGGGLLGMMMAMQQKSQDNMLMMMNQNSQNMMNLFGIMMQNNGGNSYNDAVKDAMNMVTSMVDMKNALNPEKEGLVDKIFGFMQTMGPEVARVLAQPRAAAKQDPMVQMAKNRPEMQEVMNDQAAMDALAVKLDADYGVKQANEILDVMGMKRSDQLKNHLKQGGHNPEPTAGPPPNAEDGEVTEVNRSEIGKNMPNDPDEMDSLE
jgi:hypothetical protein